LSYERLLLRAQFTARPAQRLEARGPGRMASSGCSVRPGPVLRRVQRSAAPTESDIRHTLPRPGQNLLDPPALPSRCSVSTDRRITANGDDEARNLLVEIAFAKLAKALRAARSGGPRRVPGTAPAAAGLLGPVQRAIGTHENLFERLPGLAHREPGAGRHALARQIALELQCRDAGTYPLHGLTCLVGRRRHLQQ